MSDKQFDVESLFLVIILLLSFSPTHHFDLTSCCSDCRLYVWSIAPSPASLWRTELEGFHTGHSLSKQHDGLMKDCDHVILLGFVLSRWAANSKTSIFGNIVIAHSGFSPPSKVLVCHVEVSSYDEVMNGLLTLVCLTSCLFKSFWLNVCGWIMLRWLNHKIAVGCFISCHLFLPQTYWSITSFKYRMRLLDESFTAPLLRAVLRGSGRRENKNIEGGWGFKNKSNKSYSFTLFSWI